MKKAADKIQSREAKQDYDPLSQLAVEGLSWFVDESVLHVIGLPLTSLAVVVATRDAQTSFGPHHHTQGLLAISS